MNALPGLLKANLQTTVADIILGNFQKLCEVTVGKSILLRLGKHLVRRNAALLCKKRLLFLDEFLHLLDKPLLYVGLVVNLIHGSTLAECFVHLEMTLAGRRCQLLQQLLLAELMEILHKAEAVASGLQAADCLLESFLVGLTDAHDLAYGAHLRAELVLNTLELLKCPAGELDYYVVTARNILIEGAAFAAGKFLKSKARCQHCGNEGNREARSLRSQSRGTGCSRVDLDYDDTIALRVMGELYVGSADNLHAVYNLVSLLLQTLLNFLGNRKHRCRAEGVAGVNTHRVDVLDEANRDHVAFAVADNLKLQLLPAEDGLLNQHLAYEAGLKTSRANGAELFLVVHKTAAGAAHGVSRTENYRVAELVGNRKGLVNAVRNLASRHLDAELVHCILKLDSVLTALDGIHLHADNLHVVFVQNTCLVEFCAEVQSGLSAEVRQQRIRALLCDDTLKAIHIQRLDVRHVRHFRVGHDRRRIRVYKHNLVPEFPERLARLRAGVVKLTRLSDDDRAGADNQYFVDVCSFCHCIHPP